MAEPLLSEPVSEVDFGLDFRPPGPLLPGGELHREMARLRERYRLAPIRFGEFTMQLITSHADLEAAFRDDEGLPAGPTYAMTVEPCQGVTFESLDGPEHHLLRDLSTREMRARPVARYAESALPPLVDSVIDRCASRGEADLVSEFTAVFPFLVFADRMGLPLDASDRFMDWAFGILGYQLDHQGGLAAARELTEYLEPVMQERMACPLDDQLSSMLTSERDGRRLSEEEVRSHVRALFSAGATTSYHGIGNTLFAVLSNDGAAEALRADPSRIPSAVDEMLRWEPPLALLPRLASEDVVVAGHDVPAGTMLVFGIASANRDPAVYESPDEFLPGRTNPSELTFGLGSHYCPGSHLAKAQISVAVGALLDRLPGLELVDTDAAVPNGTVMRGPRALPVRWRPN